jgi:hypothetical protein
MKNLFILILICCVGYFGYQKYSSGGSGLYGKYELDVDAMIKQLENKGISQASIDAFRKQMGNGRTTTRISKDKITITISGESVDFSYELVSKNGNCTTIRGEGKTLDYCVENDTLEVHNKQNSMFEVYRRI